MFHSVISNYGGFTESIEHQDGRINILLELCCNAIWYFAEISATRPLLNSSRVIKDVIELLEKKKNVVSILYEALSSLWRCGRALGILYVEI